MSCRETTTTTTTQDVQLFVVRLWSTGEKTDGDGGLHNIGGDVTQGSVVFNTSSSNSREKREAISVYTFHRNWAPSIIWGRRGGTARRCRLDRRTTGPCGTRHRRRRASSACSRGLRNEDAQETEVPGRTTFVAYVHIIGMYIILYTISNRNFRFEAMLCDYDR